MVDSPAPLDDQDSTPPLWQRFALAFEHRHATVSRRDLLAMREHFNATETDIAAIIQWALYRELVELVDKGERLRLTPQGRRLWRELMGEF